MELVKKPKMNNAKKPLTAVQALNRAAALCSRSEQAPGDISSKLVTWGLSAQEADEVVARLTEQGFLNEERYARAFVNDRFSFNGWGKVKIVHQLRSKGVAAQVIQEALAVIDEERYRERLVELLRAKWRTVKGREPRLAWAAMMRFAVSRGFESSIAGECVKLVTHIDDQDN